MLPFWLQIIIGALLVVFVFQSLKNSNRAMLNAQRILYQTMAGHLPQMICGCLGDSDSFWVKNPNYHVKWLEPCLVVISDKLLPKEIDIHPQTSEFIYFWAPYHRPLIAPAIKMYKQFAKDDPPIFDMKIEYYISKTLMEKKLADGSIVDKGNGQYEIIRL